MGLSLKGVGRMIAKPFEAGGQAVKHFFTGPEYDQVAGNINANYQATGQTPAPPQMAPQGPMGGASMGMPTVGGRTNSMQPSTPSAPGSSSNGLSIPDWAKALVPRHPDGSIDWGKAAQMGLVIGTVYEGYKQSQKADKLSDEAIGIERERNAAMKPLRDQAIARLAEGRQTPDLSELTDQTNPYRRGMRAVGTR